MCKPPVCGVVETAPQQTSGAALYRTAGPSTNTFDPCHTRTSSGLDGPEPQPTPSQPLTLGGAQGHWAQGPSALLPVLESRPPLNPGDTNIAHTPTGQSRSVPSRPRPSDNKAFRATAFCGNLPLSALEQRSCQTTFKIQRPGQQVPFLPS